jgi:two-component system, NarL family, sensor kinase
MVEESFTSANEIVEIIFFAVGLLFLMVLVILFFFYFSRRKVIKTKLEKANLEIAYQKELLQATILTQEEERKRIAQDLHDAISSKLNIVSLNANMLTSKSLPADEVIRVGESIYNVTSNVLENSRRIAHDLLPPTLDKFGLMAAMEELCEEIEATQKFELEYLIQYPEKFLNITNELHLFRVVQELFNNSIKHSDATKIELIVKAHENLLSLKYCDNGKGFDTSKAQMAKGLGMSGIENRTILMKAGYTVSSFPGKGIKVIIECKSDYEN